MNDINAPLMKLWEKIINNPGKISAAYRKLWDEQHGNERDYYDKVRDLFNETGEPHYLLYLLSRCVKASPRYNAFGQMNQSPDNRRKGMHPFTKEKHINDASTLLRGKTTLFAGDYRNILKLAVENDVVYMDPPYQGVCDTRDKRYISGLNIDEFIDSLEKLNRKKISYIVSYDGKTGEKKHGRDLPERLCLKQFYINAGVSSQETLLGRNGVTWESLYLSNALVERLGKIPRQLSGKKDAQMVMFK
jgi:DNA adenine methylase